MRIAESRIARSLLAAAALLTATGAAAGYRWVMPVTIGTNYVQGALGSARNSANSVEYIGCGLYATATTTYAMCYAADAAGTSVSCYADRATAPTIYDAIASLKGDGYLAFYWDANGNCTRVTVTTRSFFEPKAP